MAAALKIDEFSLLDDRECDARIRAAKQLLGDRLVILGHHYQRNEVFAHADISGDSLKLSKLAADTAAEHIVFCGVHFMAEVADIVTGGQRNVILPDLAAGCSMADMANLAKVNTCWRELAEVLDPDEMVTPVTYINSAADLKAFCGNHGGIVCTSSNLAACSTGPGRGARRCCSFRISTSAATPATTWVCRSRTWWSGISRSPWAA